MKNVEAERGEQLDWRREWGRKIRLREREKQVGEYGIKRNERRDTR